MSNKKLHNLQILRGIAALLVCCYHAKSFLNTTNIKFGDLLFKKGSIGVPLFFILSGFIMVYTNNFTSKNTLKNVKTFFLKRIVRVVPLYYFLTILFFLLVTNYNDLLNDGAMRIIKTFLFIPTGGYPPLYVGWTLNYEMFFYLIFGISLFFKKNQYVFLYVFFAISVFIIPLIREHHFSINSKNGYDAKNYLDLITHPILLQFVLGVFIGNILPIIKLNNSLIKKYVITSISLFILYYFNLFNFILSDLVVCGFLVFSLITLDQSNITLKSSKTLIYFGDISYSIYLVHPILIICLPKLFTTIGLFYLVDTMLFFFIVLTLTILSAIILYEIIEKRLTSFIRRLL